MMKVFGFRIVGAGVGLFLWSMGIFMFGSASVLAASSDSASTDASAPIALSDAEIFSPLNLALADEEDTPMPPPPPPSSADDASSSKHSDASDHRRHRRSPRWQGDQEPGGPLNAPAPDSDSAKDRPSPPHGPAASMPRQLSPEQIQTALEILNQQNPPLAQRIREAMEKHPDDVNRLIFQQWPRLGRLVEMKKRDPALFNLTMDEFRLHRQIWQTRVHLRRSNNSPEQTTVLQNQLKEYVEKLFDIRQAMRQQEVQKLEKRLDEVRQQIQTNQVDRQNLINKHVEELLKKKSDKLPPRPEADPPAPPDSNPPHPSFDAPPQPGSPPPHGP